MGERGLALTHSLAHSLTHSLTWGGSERGGDETMVMEVDTATDAGLAKLDAHLLDNSYISGVQASLDDLTVFMTFKTAPDASLKSVSRWYKHIAALLNGSFPGPPTGIKLAVSGGKKKEKPKEEPKPKKAEPTAEELA